MNAAYHVTQHCRITGGMSTVARGNHSQNNSSLFKDNKRRGGYMHTHPMVAMGVYPRHKLIQKEHSINYATWQTEDYR